MSQIQCMDFFVSFKFQEARAGLGKREDLCVGLSLEVENGFGMK